MKNPPRVPVPKPDSGRNLPAKLARPRAAGLVDRPRLFALIDAQRDPALLWIAGPPGAGKTSLASTYLAQRKGATLWYRIDADDADPATFFSVLAQGARALRPKGKFDLPALTPEYLLDLPGFCRRFFRALFKDLPRGCTVVLDAYEGAASDMLDMMLAIAVGEVPPGARLVVTSRAAPSAALAHLIVTGALAAIQAADMRLSHDEARAIAGPAWTSQPRRVDALYALCDGWTAGFVVLLGHARQSADAVRPIDGMSQEALAHYFGSEMFRRADEGARQVLMRTALLPSFTERQAQALHADSDAGATIGWLHQHHFFIDRDASAEPVYRYHALFREFLLEQGVASFSPDERRELLVRGADLLAADGRGEEAVSLFIEAGQWAEAARLLGELAPACLAQGRNAWLDRQLGALPPATLEALPWLGYWLGLARLPFAPPAARALLEAAHARMEAARDTPGQLSCCAGILDSYWVEWSEVAAVDRWAEIVASALAQGDEFLGPDLRIRLLAALPGLGFRAKWHVRLLPLAVSESFRLLECTPDPTQRLVLANVIGWLSLNTGDWRRFEELVDAEDAGFLGADLPPLHLISWHTVRCATVWITGSFELAERELLRAQALADASGVHVFDPLIASHAAYYAIGARAPQRAEAAVARMRASLNPARKLDMAHCESIRAAVSLLRGDADQALRHAREATALAVVCGSEIAEMYCRLGAAMALIHLRRQAEAETETARVIEIATTTGSPFFRYLALMLRTLMLHARGDGAASLDGLREGLALAREKRFLSCGLLYPQILDALCPVALRAGIEVDYVRDLIRKLKIPPPPNDVAAWPWPVRITTLGGFAIDVDDAPLEFGRKTPRRLLLLVKWLVAQGGEGSARSAIDALWPDEEADAAMNSLDAALHRLRKLLGGPASIELADGILRLDRASIRADALAFEKLLDEASDGASLDQALDGYRGHFLPDDTDAAWTLSMHERLRARYVEAVTTRGHALEAAGAFESAAARYARAIDIDDLAETLYQGLMRCQLALSRRSEGLATYGRLQRILQARLGLKPSRVSEELLRSLHEG